MKRAYFLFFSLMGTSILGAAESHGSAPHLDGSSLSIAWVIPFVGILLSIAVLPLIAERFWHRNFGKISTFWALTFIIPFLESRGWELTLYEILHVALLEYIPFIILLLALFTVSGGVRLKGTLVGTPYLNSALILTGTVLASWMGTTGAAMLMIRPLIRANSWRKYKVHIMVFFIFLVANIGGSLTPLGDPPLFLGFLKGVNFFWTTKAMLVPMLFMVVILLIVFYITDLYFYKKEDPSDKPIHETPEKLGIEGGRNIILILGIIGSVLLSGFWDPHNSITIFHVQIGFQNLIRDILLLMITGMSIMVTEDSIRKANGFTWFPIQEVAKLFAGIFITIIPTIAILKAGTEGALSSVIRSVSVNGQPVNTMYFWATGILSSFLDNAPTYLVFFNSAGGDAVRLMGEMSGTLLAISMGAVFMGANTYIGNAPNFMVKSISEERGIKMPSFFGYLFKYSFPILFPLYFLVSLIFL